MHSAVITKPDKKVFAVLDVGTTKVSCVLVKIIANNKIKILGIGYKKSAGIYSGAIVNAKEASDSVLSVIEEVEEVSSETIEEVYLNVVGTQIKSRMISSTISDIHNKVAVRDIRRIFNKNNENMKNDEIIIHNIPLEYILDDIRGIADPIGMYGHVLHVNMHTISLPNSVLLNLQHCVTQHQTRFNGCVLSAYSAGVACINKDEKELGVTVIDIGGGSTSIGVFSEGGFVYAASIPVGGVLITRDIASAFSIDLDSAEKLKVLKGNVILTTTDQNDIVEVEKVGEENDKVQISLSDLISVIRPRVEEIFEMVKNEIKGKNIHRVVLTGGSSQLTSIRELASHILGCQVRLGTPLVLEGMGECNRNPSLSATIGAVVLISKIIQDRINSTEDGIISKIIHFIKGY